MKNPRHILLNLVIISFLIFGLVVAPTNIAYAATITVTNTNDSGAGSLRQALNDAAEGDIIEIDNSLVNSTIVLTSGELAITKGLTITSSHINIDEQ